MHEPLQLAIGGDEHERILVEVLGRERPESFDADDGNWLMSRVSVASGCFRGRFECCLRAEDFAEFLQQVRRHEGDPCGSAEFSTMEAQLGFEIKGDGRGHFDVQGQAIDRSGRGSSIGWVVTIDQSDLRRLIASVSAISTAYDVRR